MENHPASLNPVGDVVQEQMYPTTMYGTRDSITLLDPWQNPNSSIQYANRGLISKLGEKVLNYLRHFAN